MLDLMFIAELPNWISSIGTVFALLWGIHVFKKESQSRLLLSYREMIDDLENSKERLEKEMIVLKSAHFNYCQMSEILNRIVEVGCDKDFIKNRDTVLKDYKAFRDFLKKLPPEYFSYFYKISDIKYNRIENIENLNDFKNWINEFVKEFTKAGQNILENIEHVDNRKTEILEIWKKIEQDIENLEK